MTENKIEKRICPVCGWRERRANCVLGVECRKKFDDQIAVTLAEGKTVDIFDYAKTNGNLTLERLNAELRRAEVLRQESDKILWTRAKKQLQESINSSNVYITKGIYKEAITKIYRQLCEQDEEHKRLSRKAYALKMAVEDLEVYLRELLEIRDRAQSMRVQLRREKEVAVVAV
jgi:hypothetical protein